MSERHAETPMNFGQRWSAPHTPLWRRLMWIGVGLVVIAIVIWLLYPNPAAQKKTHMIGANGPVPVGVARVVAGDVKVTIDGLGTVTPLATVTVHPEVTGYLNRVMFKEGQLVKAGEVLAQIDPRPFQAALDQARGQLARDEAALQKDQTDLARYESLWKANAISQQIYQDQVGTVATDKGTVMADKAAVETARVNLGFCRITAPVAGRVGLRQVDPGNLVVSGGSTAIVVVTELQPMSVIFSLPEDSINEVMRHVNAHETLSTTAFDRSATIQLATGVLSNVDNEIDPTTGMVKMRAMFDNKDLSLFPSQFVNIRLLVDTLHNQIYVPSAAIQHGAEGSYVYVVDKSMTANMRTVATGPTDGDKIAITDGLKVGEVVVVDGADRLKDGAHVTIPSGTKPTMASAGGSGQHRHHHHRQSGSQGGAQ